MLYKVIQRKNPLDRDSDGLFYAAPEYGEEMGIEELAADISKSCTLTVVDIVAVIEAFLDKMPQYLKMSSKIRLGNFGLFKLSFSANGRETEEAVNAKKDITKMRILFTPSTALKDEISTATFTKTVAKKKK